MSMKRLGCGGLLWLAALMLGCKANKSRNLNAPLPTGTFNDGTVLIPVPKDLAGFVPPEGANLKSSLSSSGFDAIKGLGLAAPPVSSEGIEEIIYRCYDDEDDFIAEGWYFYAQLLSNGKVLKDFETQSVNKCGQMQLTLKTLARNRTYVVKAAFYWQSPNKKTTIVWYEGETKPFKPDDRDMSLVLAKLRTDQKVNVDVDKSEKDKCILENYLWTGLRCLNGYFGVSFVHADYTDYADAEAPKRRKCLDLRGSTGVLSECNFSIHQRLRPRLVSIQDVPESFKTLDGELGWFQLYFDSGPNGTPYCLAATLAPSGSPMIMRELCADPKSFPPAHQLWNLIPLSAGDGAARNAFKLVSQFDNSVRCISVPAEQGSVTPGPSIRSGAAVRLTPCNTSDNFVRESQPIQFWGADD